MSCTVCIEIITQSNHKHNAPMSHITIFNVSYLYVLMPILSHFHCSHMIHTRKYKFLLQFSVSFRLKNSHKRVKKICYVYIPISVIYRPMTCFYQRLNIIFRPMDRYNRQSQSSILPIIIVDQYYLYRHIYLSSLSACWPVLASSFCRI